MNSKAFLCVAVALLAAPAFGQAGARPDDADVRARVRARLRQPAAPAEPRREDRPGDRERLTRVLDGLERGLESLRELGMREEYRRLSAVADDVRRQLAAERPDAEPRRERIHQPSLPQPPDSERQRMVREYFERLRSQTAPDAQEGRPDDPAPRPVARPDAPRPPRPARAPRPPRAEAPPAPPAAPEPARIRATRPAPDADTGPLEDRLERLEDRLDRMEQMTERLIRSLGERPRRE